MMRTAWREMAQRYAARSRRERLILALACLALTWGGFDLFLLQPLQAQIGRRQAELAAMTDRLTQLEEAHAQAVQTLTQAARKQQSLQAGLAEARKELPPALADSPDASRILRTAMAHALEKQGGVRVLAMRSLPPERLREGDPLVLHGLELTLAAPYALLVDHLRGLEQAVPGLLWGPLKLEADAMGPVRLQVRLQALGEEEAWLGL